MQRPASRAGAERGERPGRGNGRPVRSVVDSEKVRAFRVRLLPPDPAPSTDLDALESIRSFLDSVRRRLRRRHAVRTALHTATALVAVAALLPLAALVAPPAHGRAVALAGLALAGIGLVAAGLAGAVWPRRRWRSDRVVARFVGRHERLIASDLLSAVELGEGLAHDVGRGQVSRELTGAFLAHTARQVAVIDPAGLDILGARRSLRRAAGALGLTLLAGAGLGVAVPAHVAQGWQQLLSTPAPGPFAGARMIPGPLVGDMQITLEYPAYTERPPQVLPSTSGDFRAMPGTTVIIETRALAPAAEARVIFGAPGGHAGAEHEAGAERAGDGAAAGEAERGTDAPAGTGAATAEDGQARVDVGPDGRDLRARFTVTGAGVYRFWMESADGERRVESQPRRIEIDADMAPTVALYAPADELDVTRLKRVELAYIAEDDYGISKVELVWESRGKVERKPLSPAEAGRRSVQNKLLWDLAELTLEPGVPVRYFLEVTDNDTASGPKTTRSRAYVLRVFSPREQHEQLVARQRELFEKLLAHLGARLVMPQSAAGPGSDVRAHRLLGREAESIVVEIGTVLAAFASDPLADDSLRQALDEMRGRIEKLAEGEAELLDRANQGRAPSGLAGRLDAANAKLVAELEDDALLLADWLDRQSMENLLAISDEVKTHQERLRQLFDELERTGSADIMSEIEREMRALEQRMAEMAQKRGHMPEDVLDRFMHAEALPEDETRDCMSEVRALLRAGDAAGAREQAERCMLALDQAAESMEEALRALRGERFREEERRFAQMMSDLSDLSEDQRELAGDAAALWERYAARADDMMRDKLGDTREQVMGTLQRLRGRLGQVPAGDLTPFAREELEIVDARLADVQEMLEDGDIAEALSMARQAREGMEIMLEELQAALQDEHDDPWGARTRQAAGMLRRAQPLAQSLVAELESHTPSPEEIMSRDDRRMLERLRRRQQAMGERARRLGERIRQMGESLPGEAGEAVAGGLDRAGTQMGRATERMRGRDPSGARHESGAAAETLERTLEDARGAARRRQAAGSVGLRDEPIRIPGAEEYRAPEQFREDILEAMKREQAPEGFGEMVKRYYEELVR